jgi:RHS repeat-associated protein
LGLRLEVAARALTNSSGTISAVDSYKYDPFDGKVSAIGTVANPWRYVGQYLDTETGMYHMGARYYDPTIARFTQQDPQAGQLARPLTLNRYLYANDNPVNSCDPTGESSSSTGVCVMGTMFLGGETLTGLAEGEMGLAAAGATVAATVVTLIGGIVLVGMIATVVLVC